MRGRRRQEGGYALLAALLVLLIVSISLALLAAALQIRMRLVLQEAETLQLGALADAALAETLHRLTYDPELAEIEEHPFGEGEIASEIEKIGLDHYTVRATGIYAGQRRTVEAGVVRTDRGARVVWWRRAPPGHGP